MSNKENEFFQNKYENLKNKYKNLKNQYREQIIELEKQHIVYLEKINKLVKEHNILLEEYDEQAVNIIQYKEIIERLTTERTGV